MSPHLFIREVICIDQVLQPATLMLYHDDPRIHCICAKFSKRKKKDDSNTPTNMNHGVASSQSWSKSIFNPEMCIM